MGVLHPLDCQQTVQGSEKLGLPGHHSMTSPRPESAIQSHVALEDFGPRGAPQAVEEGGEQGWWGGRGEIGPFTTPQASPAANSLFEARL